MQRPGYIPQDYIRIEVVDSVETLIKGEMPDCVNVMLFPRRLSGDFNALAQTLLVSKGKDPSELQGIRKPDIVKCRKALTHEGRLAADTVLDDLAKMRQNFSDVDLRLIPPTGYTEEIHTYHIDGGNLHLLCDYNGPVTEALRNDDAIAFWQQPRGRQIAIEQEMGARGIKDTLIWRSFEHAGLKKPFSFAPGDMRLHLGEYHKADLEKVESGRLAQARPGFIHRAPRMAPDTPPRLLLVCRRSY